VSSLSFSRHTDVAYNAADAAAGDEYPGAFAPSLVEFVQKGLIIVNVA